LFLATTLKNAHVTAIDLLPDFLVTLTQRAGEQGLATRISTQTCSMDDLPFSDAQLDLIWSEGAVYNIGFETGIQLWRRFLKPRGFLAVSEITWTTASRPEAIQSYWDAAYPEIATASEKIGILERHGYTPLGYLILPEECWTTGYYQPLQDRFPDFLARHEHSEAAQAIVAAEEEEIALYQRYKDFFSYGFYIAQKSE
jgi:SAM-dependent methyltransferase